MSTRTSLPAHNKAAFLAFFFYVPLACPARPRSSSSSPSLLLISACSGTLRVPCKVIAHVITACAAEDLATARAARTSSSWAAWRDEKTGRRGRVRENFGARRRGGPRGARPDALWAGTSWRDAWISSVRDDGREEGGRMGEKRSGGRRETRPSHDAYPATTRTARFVVKAGFSPRTSVRAGVRAWEEPSVAGGGVSRRALLSDSGVSQLRENSVGTGPSPPA